MLRTENQNTFMSSAQFIQGALTGCREVEQDIREHLQEVDDNKRIEMQHIADHEHKLASALERYLESGPDDVLNTRLQYQLDGKILENYKVNNLQDALKKLTRFNNKLATTFHDQAEKSGSPSVSEAMANLSSEFEALNRKISMIQVADQDV